MAFHQGKIDRAAQYYKEALGTIAASGENNPVAQERLVAKLADTIQHQVIMGTISYIVMHFQHKPEVTSSFFVGILYLLYL